MTAVYGYHVQIPQPRWVEGVDRQPPGAWNKSVDNVHTLQEAKAHNPQTFTLYRKWYDTGQVFGGDWEANCQRFRVFANTFIDDTFRQLAPSVDAVSDFNEYLANSQSEEEVNQRILWVQASQWVWTNEYRTQPELAHIRLASCAAAVGNDIHLEMARAVADNGGLLDYHVYTAVRAGSTRSLVPARLESLATHPPRAKFTGTSEPYFVTPPPGWNDSSHAAAEGVIPPDEWQWYSGRWTMMDAQFVAHGVYCDWVFGEGGAVLQYDHGGLGPLDGWRHPDVYGGNIDRYLEMMKYWLDKTAEWNHTHNNRAKGAVLFTTGGPGSTWDLFEVLQPEINIIADAMRNYTPPTFPPVEPPPEPPPIEEHMRTLIQRNYTENIPAGANELVVLVRKELGVHHISHVIPLAGDERYFYTNFNHNTEYDQQPSITPPALVADVSGNQAGNSAFNAAAARANGIAGLLVRTSNGILRNNNTADANGVDRKLWNHLAQARDNGLAYGLYHFANAQFGVEQIDHWMSIIQQALDSGFTPTLGLWLDFEESSPATEALIRALCEAAVAQNITDQPIGIYTRAGWWNPIVPVASDWPRLYKIWVANWVNGGNAITTPPATPWQYLMPHHWTRPANFWQFTSKGGAIAGHGVENLDVNWYLSEV